MFQGLDAIEWETLEHAYGPATDVPDQLRALASGDDTAVEAALDDFFSNIYHQGTVYPASVMAVPYLVEALDFIGPDHLATLLELLRCLAEGHGYYDAHQHLSIMEGVINEMDDIDGVLARERSIVADTTRAVFAHWNAYLPLLRHGRRDVRLAALKLLAQLAACDAREPPGSETPIAYLGVRPNGSEPGEWAAQLRRRLAVMRDDGPDELEGAAMIDAAGQIDPADVEAMLAESLRPFECYTALRILVPWAVQADGTLPDPMADELCGLVEHYKHLEACQSAKDWIFHGRVEHWWLPAMACASDAALERYTPAILSLIEQAHNISADKTMYAVLHMALGQPVPEISETTTCPLPPWRRAIAEAIVNKGSEMDEFGMWSDSFGNASLVFQRMGVTRDRATWMAWLGIAPKRPDRGKFRLRWPWRK